MVWMKGLRRSMPLVLMAGALVAQTPAVPTPGGHRAHRGAHFGQGGDRGMTRMAEALGLTDMQKQQARALFEEQRTGTQETRTQLRQVGQQLQAAMRANDTAQIQALSQQRGVLMGRMLTAQAETSSRFRALLTPDQQAKADQLRQQRRSRFQDGVRGMKRQRGPAAVTPQAQ